MEMSAMTIRVTRIARVIRETRDRSGDGNRVTVRGRVVTCRGPKFTAVLFTTLQII